MWDGVAQLCETVQQTQKLPNSWNTAGSLFTEKKKNPCLQLRYSYVRKQYIISVT